MAGFQMTVRLEGVPPLKRKLTPAHRFLTGPTHRYANRVGTVVRNFSRQRAPRWRGGLQKAITYRVLGGTVAREVRVEANAVHAAIHEFGHAPYWPPPTALEGWAAAHGFGPGGGFLVARAISRRGIAAKHYMRDGVAAAEPRVRAYADQMQREIEAEAVRA